MEKGNITVTSLAEIKKDKEVRTVLEGAMDVTEKAVAIEVVDEKTAAEAGEIRMEAQRAIKTLESRRKFFVEPHNMFVKGINAMFRTHTDAFESAMTVVGGKLLRYSDKIEKEQKEKEAKILADRRTTAETKSEKIAQVVEAPKVVRSESATTSFRIDKKLKIVDASKLPREYLVPDERFILAALKAGKEVPGAVLEDVKVLVGRGSF